MGHPAQCAMALTLHILGGLCMQRPPKAGLSPKGSSFFEPFGLEPFGLEPKGLEPFGLILILKHLSSTHE